MVNFPPLIVFKLHVQEQRDEDRGFRASEDENVDILLSPSAQRTLKATPRGNISTLTQLLQFRVRANCALEIRTVSLQLFFF
jgi:hypothetical protein